MAVCHSRTLYLLMICWHVIHHLAFPFLHDCVQYGNVLQISDPLFGFSFSLSLSVLDMCPWHFASYSNSHDSNSFTLSNNPTVHSYDSLKADFLNIMFKKKL
jgi:hypothetical protein